FERRPLLVHGEPARLEARHVEEVADQAVQPVGLFEDRLKELAAHRRRFRLVVLEERARRTGDGGERSPEVVRDRAEQRVPELLPVGAETRGLRFLREPRALERHRDLLAEGLEQLALARLVEAMALVFGLDAEDAERARRDLERDVERARSRQRARAE